MSVEFKISGTSTTKIFANLRNITAKQIGTVAKKEMKEVIRPISTQLAAKVEQDSLDEHTERIFIGEGTIHSKMVPGNRRQSFIQANLLTTFLDKGTSAHFVSPVNAKALHWGMNRPGYFSKGHNVKGIQPKNFWNYGKIKEAVGSFILEKFKAAFK